MGSEAFGIGAIILLISYPFGLLAAVLGLGVLERRIVTPGEHAAEMERLLAVEDPDTIEHAVAGMLAQNADLPERRIQTSTLRRMRRQARSVRSVRS